MTARNQRPNDGVVRLRRAGNIEGRTGQLTVPSYIAQAIPWGTLFRAEVTDDGILYRYLATADSPELLNAPQWIKELPHD